MPYPRQSILLVLCAVLLGLSPYSFALQYEITRSAERISSISLENSLLRVSISEKGARLSQLYLKQSGIELSQDNEHTFSGLGKFRDVLFNNVETISARHSLELDESQPGLLKVSALYTAKSGNLAGMQIIRSFILRENAAYLDCQLMLRCIENPASFQLNMHNFFPVQENNTDLSFYLPTQRGLAKFSHSEAVLQKMNLILDPAQPWCAFIDHKNRAGLAVVAKNLQLLDAMYVWAVQNSFTLEMNFKEAQLRPVAAADEWEVEYRLVPLQGINDIRKIDANGAFALEQQNGDWQASFMALSPTQAEFSARQGDKTLASQQVDLKWPNQCANLQWQKEKDKQDILLSFTAKEFSSELKLTNEEISAAKIKLLSELPKRELTGVNGFYYYFPELWLSDEAQTAFSFGLRGDFRKRNDFRFAIDLPEGVELTHSPAKILAESTLELQGKAYKRVEIHSFRKIDYYNSITLHLQIGPDFKEGSQAYIQALWKGGAQTAEAITLKQAPKMRNIGSGFKHFKLGMHDDIARQAWPPFARMGVNVFMLSRWAPPLILYGYHGKGHLQTEVDNIKQAGMFPIYGYPDPYTAVGRVLQKMQPYYKGACTLYHPEEKYIEIDLEDAKALNIHGKRVNMPCPSFHGQLLDKAVDSLKSVIDYGFEHMTYDEEMWSSGNTICYCQRCKNKFAEFLKNKYPQLEYMDPATATLEANKYPEIFDAWWDFKTDQVAEIYKTLRHTIDTYEPRGEKRQIWVWVDYSVGPGRYGAITHRLTDYAKLGQYTDLLLPMIYTPNALDVARCIENGYKALAGKRGKIAAGLSPNRTYEYFRVASGNLAPEDAMRQQLLETFFNGGQAAVVWAWKSALRGALDYYKMSEAVYMLLPVENILYAGERQDSLLQNSNPDVKLTVWEHQGKLAVFLRNYESETLKTSLVLPPGYKSITDTLTRETIPYQNKLELSFQDERLKVLLIE
ncbi:MAG: hypothetical protein GX901_02715 [Lentisphaerae bacterium]|nr:hypothetical protein [Lentisphaerota bacterium]